ncbi:MULTISPECIES: DUF5655 domain-containing protein [Lactobacillaceae]|uniref:DUF5655 domain-containing protein n=1 Tax=Lactobacillaceae TaxID=33958 RepID=UPI0014574E14|nr:DUF5655 domain-containing protein [Lactobacillus sp. HBUAS51381]NLR09835.1 transporter [Lactobacillus sp. HBUAS51381]
MDLYKLNPDKVNGRSSLSKINPISFKNEKKLQTCIENNLELTIGPKFVATEFTVGKYRLDTVAYDDEVKAFVIIEYKKTTKYSVIDQGYAYLNTLLNHKADFVLAYNERYGESQSIDYFDWSQVRLIFIAQSFDDYQKDAADNPSLPIELYEANLFSNNELIFNKISKGIGMQKTANNVEKISSDVSKSETIKIKDAKDLRLVSEEELLAKSNENVQEVYAKIKEALLTWDTRFEVKVTKVYVGFRIDRHNVVDLLPQKKKLKIWINLSKGELDDSVHLFRDVSHTGHWGNGDYELSIANDEQLEYILSLMKQAWRKHS